MRPADAIKRAQGQEGGGLKAGWKFLMQISASVPAPIPHGGAGRLSLRDRGGERWGKKIAACAPKEDALGE